MSNENSSIDLVSLAQSGDLDAFGQLVCRFQDMAYAHAYAYLGDAHLAQDAAQEAFLDAYGSLAGLREPAAFPGWLRKIVFKHSDRLVRGKQLDTIPLDDHIRVFATTAPDPASITEAAELRSSVREAIATLPEHERVVVLLFYIAGYTQNDMAACLDLPLTTIKKRLHDARKRLKERMLDMITGSLSAQRPSHNERFSRTVQFLVAVRIGNLARVRAWLVTDPSLVNAYAEGDQGLSPYLWMPMSGMTPLFEAVSNGHTALAELLINHSADARSPTLLHHAATNNHSAVAELLIRHGADPNTSLANGHTPLHWATIRGHRVMVELLLSHGANPQQQSNGGRTPLHWAALKGYPTIAAAVLRHGADPSITDDYGRTALDWATRNGQHAVVEVLSLHTAT